MSRPLILRNNDFLLLWFGQILSQAGSRMFQIALLWWLVERGGQSAGLVVGSFLVVGALPAILFVKPIGLLIDRVPSKKVLVTSDTVSAATVFLLLPFLSTGFSVHASFVIQFLLSVLYSIFTPALNKAIPELVLKEDIEAATAFQTSTQAIANFGGAAVGALVIAKLGIVGVVVINGICFIVSALCNLIIRFRYVIASTESGLSETRSDFRIKGVLRKVLLGFGVANFFATPTLVILPLYTAKVINGSAAQLACLEAAVWAGMLIGSFATSLCARVSNTLLIAAFAMFIHGTAMSIPGLVPNFWLFVGLLAVGHLMVGISNVRFISFFQNAVEANVKGQFFARLQAMVSFTFPAAFFIFGFLGDLWDPQKLCLLQGAGVIATALYFLLLSRKSTLA